MKPLTITLQPEWQIIAGALLALGAFDAAYYGTGLGAFLARVWAKWRWRTW